MKTQQLLLITIFSIFLTACASVSQEQPVDVLTGQPSNLKPYIPAHCPPPKKKQDPVNVSLYTKGSHPGKAYKVIGLESVSKYNHVGIKRQEASIHDTLREIAAAMGGDAVIDLKSDKHFVSGRVVTYKNAPEEGLA